MNAVTSNSDNFAEEIQEFKNILESSGVHSALHFLNKRTPHRFTGIYRYDQETLRNLALYDVYNPELEKGEDAPMQFTYCSLLKNYETLEINNAAEDIRVKDKIITPVISYFGVLMRDLHGAPIGSLCHFDMQPCDERLTDFPLLESAAKILSQYFYAQELKKL